MGNNLWSSASTAAAPAAAAAATTEWQHRWETETARTDAALAAWRTLAQAQRDAVTVRAERDAHAAALGRGTEDCPGALARRLQIQADAERAAAGGDAVCAAVLEDTVARLGACRAQEHAALGRNLQTVLETGATLRARLLRSSGSPLLQVLAARPGGARLRLAYAGRPVVVAPADGRLTLGGDAGDAFSLAPVLDDPEDARSLRGWLLLLADGRCIAASGAGAGAERLVARARPSPGFEGDDTRWWVLLTTVATDDGGSSWAGWLTNEAVDRLVVYDAAGDAFRRVAFNSTENEEEGPSLSHLFPAGGAFTRTKKETPPAPRLIL